MKPIIFSTPMVQAILDGRKTQTRRVVKPQPRFHLTKRNIGFGDKWVEYSEKPLASPIEKSPWGYTYDPKHSPGDILWVRETWRLIDFSYIDGDVSAAVQYKDGIIGDHLRDLKYGMDERTGWRPSIHMPRAAARIFLRMTGVRVERLQDISPADCMAEGITPQADVKLKTLYARLWNSLNAKRGYPWGSNPWVWVYKFERIEKP